MKKIAGLLFLMAVVCLSPLSAEERELDAQTNLDARSEASGYCEPDQAYGTPSASTPSRSFDGGAPFKVAAQDCLDESNQAYLECRAVGGSMSSCAMIAAYVYYTCE